MANHRGRKLFADSVPSGMGRLRIIVTGNYLRMVSYSAWDKGDSSRQETFRQEISRLRFAALEMTGEGETIVYHGGRKLVEKVSYPAWDDGKSSWQETVCVWFLIRHETVVYHSGRKLLANGFLFGVGQR